MQTQNYSQNPIEQIVESAIFNIKKAAETNTIVGQPFIGTDGSTIMPISQVSFAFVAGGGEYDAKKAKNDSNFAGGSGGGATLSPVGFLITNKDGVKLIKFDGETTFQKVVDVASSLIEAFRN